MRRHIEYGKYVLRHKWFVFLAGIKLGIPLWMLILHDWDKFLPDEWFPYARTFYKPDGSKQYQESPEFAHAWMLHQHRNKHHWQWWLQIKVLDTTPLHKTDVLVWDRGEAQQVLEWFNYPGREPRPRFSLRNYIGTFVADPMPDVYRREMLADWRGAGMALNKPDTCDWYLKNKDKMKLHPETRAWIEQQLGVSQ